MLNRLLIDLSWASSQLEGNPYSRLDTERLIEFGQAAEGKGALETQMILNHKQAIEYLVLDPAHAHHHIQSPTAHMGMLEIREGGRIEIQFQFTLCEKYHAQYPTSFQKLRQYRSAVPAFTATGTATACGSRVHRTCCWRGWGYCTR
jgi:hypothetical protein